MPTACGRIASALLLASAIALWPAPGTHALGPNLLTNPGFEWSVAEGSITGPSPAHGTLIQPVLPTGWTFEGSAGLFDHADPRADVLGIGSRAAHGGLRFVAVSIPASGRDNQCAAEGVCVPLGAAKAPVEPAYSIDPAWRSDPIAVTAGTRYRLSTWALLDFNGETTGAFARVRWISASGQPLSLSPAAERLQGPFDPPTGSWEPMTLDATAPADAAFAQVLLGHTGDVWLGQVRFDDAFFGAL